MNATPELVKAGIKVALEHPAKVNGVALKHYDGGSFSLMRAFKQGMIEAGVQGLPPAIGKEVEEMQLEGFVPFDKEFVEEWGVETRGTGSASYTFPAATGIYDVRITYFDEKDGQSQISLRIADDEKATFHLNEDADCWRWRRFDGIQVRQGDTIKLVGKAHQRERARLDYIEFIPSTSEAE